MAFYYDFKTVFLCEDYFEARKYANIIIFHKKSNLKPAKILYMKNFTLLNIFFLIGFASIAQNGVVEKVDDEKEFIFTSKDKDYLQYWHYEQILQMDLTENGRDGYLSLLNYYTYKMSRLGLSKYGYTDAERKTKFDALVIKLNGEMKDLLNTHDYKIHEESFKKIIKLVYDKRNWK